MVEVTCEGIYLKLSAARLALHTPHFTNIISVLVGAAAIVEQELHFSRPIHTLWYLMDWCHKARFRSAVSPVYKCLALAIDAMNGLVRTEQVSIGEASQTIRSSQKRSDPTPSLD